MSLPQLLAGILDKHGDTMQQAALLAYLRQGEDAQQYLEVNIPQAGRGRTTISRGKHTSGKERTHNNI